MAKSRDPNSSRDTLREEAERIRLAEEAITRVTSSVPPLIAGVFLRLMQEGLSEAQAAHFTTEYMRNLLTCRTAIELEQLKLDHEDRRREREREQGREEEEEGGDRK